MKRIALIILIIIFILLSSCTGFPESVVKWHIDISKYIDENDTTISIHGTGDMNIAGNKLFAVRGNILFCLDKNDGEILWTYKRSSETPFNRKPLIKDNKIYLFNNEYITLTVLDINGNLILEDKSYGYLIASEAIPSVEGNYIYILGHREILSINMDTYELRELFLRNQYSGTFFASRALIKNNILYAPCSGYDDPASLLAFDLITGEKKWNTVFEDIVSVYGDNPLYHDGKLYIGVGKTIYVLDADTGDILKTYYGSGYNGMSIGNDTLFSGCWLAGYDINSTDLKWYYKTGYFIGSGSAYHNGVFYAMMYGLIALDSETGELIYPHTFENSNWEKLWEIDSTYNMPLVDGDIIYFNGLRGIYAFNGVE